MASDSQPDFFAILEALASYEVEFILVGGLCAVVHGAPVVTTDVDVVHRRSPDNLDRLVAALASLDAHYRHHPSRIVPDETHLVGPGHQLLKTNRGNLDVLGSIDGGRDYDDLMESTQAIELEGRRYRLLELGELIEIKRRAGRDKDLAVLPLLENTRRLAEATDESE